MRVVSPAPRDAWLELISQDTAATVYQTPQWLDSVCEADGFHDVSRLYETGSGQQLVLPLVRGAHRPSRFAVEESLPGAWGMGGLVGARPVDPETLTYIWTDLVTRPAARVRVRDSNLGGAPPDGAPLRSRFTESSYPEHVLDLSGGFERVWREKFRGTTRTAIRKAESSGLEVQTDNTGRLVPVFYRLYLTWIARRASERRLPVALQVYRARRRESLLKFQVIARMLGDACQVWVAWLGDLPVATAISLTHGSHAIFYRGYSDKPFASPARANELLQRSMIEDACRRGCTDYNMGGAGAAPIPGLSAYKEKFGATSHDFPVYTLESTAMRRMESLSASLGKEVRARLGRRPR